MKGVSTQGSVTGSTKKYKPLRKLPQEHESVSKTVKISDHGKENGNIFFIICCFEENSGSIYLFLLLFRKFIQICWVYKLFMVTGSNAVEMNTVEPKQRQLLNERTDTHNLQKMETDDGNNEKITVEMRTIQVPLSGKKQVISLHSKLLKSEDSRSNVK